MKDKNKTILKKRFKSFVWRLGGMTLVAILSFIAESIELFDLAPGFVVVIGLIVGEISKYLNVNLKELKTLEKVNGKTI